MNLRDKSLTNIYERIKRDRDQLGLKSLMWSKNTTIEKDNIPVVFMFEGKDIIKKYDSRNKIGYPARRELEVEIEIAAKDKDSLWDIYQKTRRAIFCTREDSIESIIWTPNNVVERNSFIMEIRTNELVTYKDPTAIGISLIVGLSYVDYGISQDDFLTVAK